MNRFILKCCLFIIPIIGMLSAEIFLPVDTFTHRPWEALLFRSNNTIYFYPNQQINSKSVGDLCHHTPFAIKKNENWITDKLGYRNNTFIKQADVLIIGDSFIVGSSITQDSTITNLLSKKINSEVYNISPAGFEDFIDLLESDVIKKPKTIIFSLVENSIPLPLKVSKKKIFREKVTSTEIIKDKLQRLYSIKFLNSRMCGKKGEGVRGKTDTTMFFLNGEKQNYHNDKVYAIANTIRTYKTFCDSLGVKFIFLPIPNKETVYYDKIPLAIQPNYLFKLDSVLREYQIETLNTLKLFNNHRKLNSSIIYHLDDSHWNATGVELVSKKILDLYFN